MTADREIEVRTFQLFKAYGIVGPEDDWRFQALPAHDKSALFNLLYRNRENLPVSAAVCVGGGIGTGAFAIHDVYAKAKVWIAERSPSHAASIRESIARNALSDHVAVLPEALGAPDAAGRRTLDERAGDLGGVDLIEFATSLTETLDVLEGAKNLIAERNPMVFLRFSKTELEAGDLQLDSVLARLTAAVGQIGVVDVLTGLASPLDAGEAGVQQLQSVMGDHNALFDLINRLDKVELDTAPPWGKLEERALRLGQGRSVNSEGIVIADHEIAWDYPNLHQATTPVVDWPSTQVGEAPLVSFSIPGAVVSSCYLTLDVFKNRLFLNQIYVDAAGWFNLRPNIEDGRYTFKSDRVIPLGGRYVVIGGPVDKAYYHWLFNWCPRLLVLKKLAPEIFDDPSVKFMIDHRAAVEPYHSFLLALGIPQERIFFADHAYDYQVDEAILVSFLPQTKYYPEVIEDFAKKVVDGLAAGPNAGSGRRRIFISRQKFQTPKRRIANMDAVEPLLLKYGFEPVMLEDLSVTEQIRLFSQAEAVIGVHGAGLANMIFCPSDCRMLLLENQRNISVGLSRMFSELAVVRGLRHQVIAVEEDVVEGVDYSSFGDVHNRDIIVDPKMLKGALESLLSA
jgi:hypothetical protein